MSDEPHDTMAATTADDTQVYRMRRSYLVSGIVYLILFASAAVGFFIGAYQNTDHSLQHPILVAWFCALFWSCWMLSSVFLIISYFRERLITSKTAITKIGVFGTQTIRRDDVRKIVWRGGTIILHCTDAKMTINANTFPLIEQAEIAAAILIQFDDAIQEDAAKFRKWFFEDEVHRGMRLRRPRLLLISVLIALGWILGRLCLIGVADQKRVLAVLNFIAAIAIYLIFLRHLRLKK